jgi:hypothetical protein
MAIECDHLSATLRMALPRPTRGADPSAAPACGKRPKSRGFGVGSRTDEDADTVQLLLQRGLGVSAHIGHQRAVLFADPEFSSASQRAGPPGATYRVG